MAYTGKFVDRSPAIRPAGKIFVDPNNTLDKCIRLYPIDDKIEALKHEAGIFSEKPKFEYKVPKSDYLPHPGVSTHVAKVVFPRKQNAFEHLISELKETTYKSYWNMEVGKSRDPVPNLPSGIDLKTFTFGKKHDYSVDVKELVNPSLDFCEVLKRSAIGHDKYVKTHNAYYVREQINRRYLKPAYNPNRVFGERRNYDPRGIFVKNCMKSDNNDELCVATSLQANERDRTASRLGKCLTPNKLIEQVPPGHTFGKKIESPLYGIQELLRESEPFHFRDQLYDWLSHANKIRNILKFRSVPEMDFIKFSKAFSTADQEEKGWLPVDKVDEICREYHVTYDKCRLPPLMTYLGILKDDQIEYNSFIDMLCWKKEFPYLQKLQDVPPKHLYFQTTYRAAREDYKLKDNSAMDSAGVSSLQMNKPYPFLADGFCKADLESLGNETSVRAAVNPSIYTQYGVTHRDFYQPRPVEQIRGIFDRAGISFTDEQFECICKQAMVDEDCKEVCIESFQNALKKFL